MSFKVIHWHRFLYQSKAHFIMRLSVVINTNFILSRTVSKLSQIIVHS